MTFKKGESGNPAGRPPGIKNRSTLLAQAMFEGEAEAVIRTAIDKAKEGDAGALRLCLDRMAPRLRSRQQTNPFDLPHLKTTADLLPALAAIASGVASGELTPGEAAELAKVMDIWLEALQALDFEERLTRLEKLFEEREARWASGNDPCLPGPA